MKELSFEKMEEVNGGGRITTSMLVCGGMAVAYGFIPVVGWAVGAGVGLACAATWEDIEGYDDVLWSW